MIDSELFSRPAILAPTVLALSYLIYQIFLKPSPISKLDLPIAGARPGDWFPYTQAKWRNFFNFKSIAIEADRLSRTADPENPHQAVLLPVLGGIPNLVQLPRSETQFVIDQPDSNLNMHDQVLDSLQLDFVLSDPQLVHQPLHHKIITTTLTSQIGNLVPDVADETAWAFNHVWDLAPGRSRDVVVYDSLRRVISGVTNRVFVGLPICRDEEILDVALSYANLMPLTGQLMSWFSGWGPLKSLVSIFLTLPLKLKYRRFCKLLRPEVKRRLAEYDGRHADPEKSSQSPPPRNDFLEWCINQAKPTGDPYLYSPDTLAGRIVLVNFAAIHTTSFAITHALLDLAYSPNKDQIIAELREEIESCLDKYGVEDTSSPSRSKKKWNKASLNAMHKLDSLFRESARLNSIVTIGLARKVSAPDGLLTPYSKIRLPKGTVVVVPSYPVFHDDETYPSADEFQPFRFSAQRADDSKEYVKRAGKAFASTGNEYLAFGHGRHACPGRFFVSNELKLVMAFIVLNFDLDKAEGVVKRPENKWYGVNVIPDFGAKVKVTRRAREKS